MSLSGKCRAKCKIISDEGNSKLFFSLKMHYERTFQRTRNGKLMKVLIIQRRFDHKPFSSDLFCCRYNKVLPPNNELLCDENPEKDELERQRAEVANY